MSGSLIRENMIIISSDSNTFHNHISIKKIHETCPYITLKSFEFYVVLESKVNKIILRFNIRKPDNKLYSSISLKGVF